MPGPFYDWDAAPPVADTAFADLEQREPGIDQTRVFDPAFTAELGALLTDEADIPTLDDNPVVDASGAPVGNIAYSRQIPNRDRSLKTAIGAVFALAVAVGAAAVASGILTRKEPALTVAPAEATTSTTSERPVATTATTLPQPRVVIATEAPATTATTHAPTTTILANRPPISIDVPALINEALQAVQSTTTTAAERTTTTTAAATTTTTPVSTTRLAPTSTTVPTLPNSSPVPAR